jgi:hypothetical protein
MSDIKPEIMLPHNPDHYYGSSITVENLTVGMTLFVGQSRVTEPMTIQKFSKNDSLKCYEIHTDKAVLLAYPLTRVQYKTT